MSTREFCLLAVIAAMFLLWMWQRYNQRKKPSKAQAKQPFHFQFCLRPKEPKDCPHCVAEVALRQVNPAPTAAVAPVSFKNYI